MEINLEGLTYSLNADEINVLLKLYYSQSGVVEELFDSDQDKTLLEDLIGKHLVSTSVDSGRNIVNLTEGGLSVCGSVMFSRVNEKVSLFREKMSLFPTRALACLVNRVMWKDVVGREDGFFDSVTRPYALDENFCYELVLLKDKRMEKMLEVFYGVIESLGFIKTVDDQRWCSPEVEGFLRDEYKDVGDLSWSEEDSLKYYFFFYVYAQDQKNLINFTGDGEEFRSMFFGEDASPPDYWFSSNRFDPRTLLSRLGVSESRIIGFLEEMQRKDIVNERYYPLSSFSFFSEDDKIFVIRDIKSYMDFIANKFLSPVVDSLLETR